MAELKVPSLQHLARNWREDVGSIKRTLVRLARHPPIFNYNPLFSATKDLLLLKQPYDQVERGIRDHVKREAVRSNFLEVLPLIDGHFSSIAPDFYQTIERRYYPVGRGLMVPFEPPMIYGVGGQLYFPWLSFWRSNPLQQERVSLFATLVDEILLDDPDLENARFQILDFSMPKAGKARELRVIDAANIPRLSQTRKLEMLEGFAQGFIEAQAELKNTEPSRDESSTRDQDPDQPGLFD